MDAFSNHLLRAVEMIGAEARLTYARTEATQGLAAADKLRPDMAAAKAFQTGAEALYDAARCLALGHVQAASHSRLQSSLMVAEAKLREGRERLSGEWKGCSDSLDHD